MKNINLKRYYPYLPKSEPLAVTDEIAATLSAGGRLGNSYQRRKRGNGECSLEAVEGYEAEVTRPPLTPEEIMEGRELRAALYAALAQIPTIQARRVYSHYILGISEADLARAEGVDRSVVCRSIERGLEKLKNILEKSL